MTTTMVKAIKFASFLTSYTTLITWLAIATIQQQQTAVSGHGYLSSPRSRNLVASQDTKWWPLTEYDPAPETCPHCLNRGGSRARCGISQSQEGTPGIERNYDSPRNAMGGRMPTRIQANYTQGQNVILDVTLTAHHKGHFVFSACPIAPNEIPSQECFDSNKLTFVMDLLHNANYDPDYPERAYIAPVDVPNYVPDLDSTRGVVDYSFMMSLPKDLYGDLVLIQWYYLTANSCYHEGYREYDWPSVWNIDATSLSLGMCSSVSPDGSGVPEQFWNCAEVKIVRQERGTAANDPLAVANNTDDPLGVAAESNAEPPKAIIVNLEIQVPQARTNSLIFALVVSLLIVVVSAFTLFIFARKRKSPSRCAEEHVDMMENATTPDDSTLTAMPPASVTSMEETWKRAIDVNDLWRDAMNTYDDKPIYLDEELIGGRSLVEPAAEQMVEDLEKHAPQDPCSESEAGVVDGGVKLLEP